MEKRLERLSERLAMVDNRLTEEQSKDAPNTQKVFTLTNRKSRIQGRIDKLSV